MRIVFMGTPSFSVPSLKALAQHHEVVGVVTRPDAPSGRGKTLYPSDVKAAALELGLAPVIETKTLRTPEIFEQLKALAPDVIVVAAYGAILPKEVLDLPKQGCINVHASLLPRWRGAAPIERAIMAGDAEAGVCIMQMEEGLDTGAYCQSAKTEIGHKSVDELTQELGELGAEILLKALAELEAGTLTWHEQDESQVTYAEKIKKAEMRLAPEMTALQAQRIIQASSDSAPARLSVFGRSLRVLEGTVAQDVALSQGEAQLKDEVLYLGFSDGTVGVTSLKPDGKGEMSVAAWAAGIRSYEPVWSAL